MEEESAIPHSASSVFSTCVCVCVCVCVHMCGSVTQWHGYLPNNQLFDCDHPLVDYGHSLIKTETERIQVRGRSRTPSIFTAQSQNGYSDGKWIMFYTSKFYKNGKKIFLLVLKWLVHVFCSVSPWYTDRCGTHIMGSSSVLVLIGSHSCCNSFDVNQFLFFTPNWENSLCYTPKKQWEQCSGEKKEVLFIFY